MRVDDSRVRSEIARLDSLIDGVQSPECQEVLGALVSLYGEALERVMDRVDDSTASAFAADELLSHLMLLHDIHPRSLSERLEVALRAVEAEHGPVDLMDVTDGVARVRLSGGASGCGSARLRSELEAAVLAAAPEVHTVIMDKATFVPITNLRRRTEARA